MLASDPGVFKLLLEHGADPNAKNYKGLLCRRCKLMDNKASFCFC